MLQTILLTSLLLVIRMPGPGTSGHDSLRMGLYFGLLLTLILHNLFVYAAIRDHAYLFYVGFLAANGLFIAHTSGLGLAYAYPRASGPNPSNYFGAAAQVFGILFTYAFLPVRKHAPRLHPVSGIILLIAAGAAGLSVAGHSEPGLLLLLCNVILFGPYVYLAGVPVWRKGFRPARFYMAAFTLLNTGVLVYNLQKLGVLPQNAFTAHAYIIGSALESIILSLALARKLNAFKREKEQAQHLALQQATAFSRQLIEARERERKRIAAELHDSIGQSLVLIKNRLLLLEQAKSEGLPARVAELTQSVGQTIQEVRNISYALRPPQLDLLGLTRALKNLVEETAAASDIGFYEAIDDIDGLLPEETQINLYRIVQECLSNLVRHARATTGNVLVRKHAGQLVVRIEDDGVGMGKTPFPVHGSGSGLPGIRERLRLLAGTMHITGVLPHGTRIHITLPISSVDRP